MHYNTQETFDLLVDPNTGHLSNQTAHQVVSENLTLQDKNAELERSLASERMKSDRYAEELIRVRDHSPAEEIQTAMEKGAKLHGDALDGQIRRDEDRWYLRCAAIVVLVLMLVGAAGWIGYLLPHHVATSSNPTPTIVIEPTDALTINAGKVDLGPFQAGKVVFLAAHKGHLVLHHMVLRRSGHPYVDEPTNYDFSNGGMIVLLMSSGDWLSVGVVGDHLPVVYHIDTSAQLAAYGCALMDWASNQYTQGFVLERNVAFGCNNKNS